METVFVERDTDPASARFGKVKGVFLAPQEGYAEEPLPEDDAAVLEFRDFVSPLINPQEVVNRGNVAATAARTRADALAEIERNMAAGAPQDQINLALLKLLKEQS